MSEMPKGRSARVADIVKKMELGELDVEAGCEALRACIQEATRAYYARQSKSR